MIKSDYQGNILWSKHIDLIPPSNYLYPLSFFESYIYGENDSVIYKLDTAGNVIWERKFSSLVNQFPNITNVTPSNDKLYAYLVETDSQYAVVNRAQLVLDTAM